jgi:hypothetical protein
MAAMTIGRRLLILWVVMSVCWVLAIGAITWSTLNWTKEWVLKPDWARNVDPAWAEFKPVCPQPDPEHNQKLCYLEDHSKERMEQVKIGAVLAFAPPIVVLVLGFAFVWVVSWVVRGFRNQ